MASAWSTECCRCVSKTRVVPRAATTENECGTRGCVNLTHNRLMQKIGQNRNPLVISARLPVEPLLDFFARHKPDRIPDSYAESLRRAAHRGYVSVTTADALCIDVLGIHPTAVYGDLFYEAA